MKKIISLLLLLPLAAVAQKEVKPSVSKTEAALQKGNIDDAKPISDATVTNQEFMFDKKGQPSKSAAKAWYLRGIIYAAIDTSKTSKYKGDADLFATAKEGFDKAEEIDKGKNKSLFNRISAGLPLAISKDEIAKTFAQAYLERGFKTYQAKDFKKAFVDIQRVLYFVPNDTTQLMNAGMYFAPNAEEYDKAIQIMKKYLAGGGKNPDVLLQLYTMYQKKAELVKVKYKGSKNPDAVLQDTAYMKNINASLEVAKELTNKYPSNVDYLNMEYNVYTQTNRLPEAKTLMEKRAKDNPNDKESRYFIGLICNELKDTEGTKQWMVEALKVDPDYFDANLVLAKLTYTEAQKLRNDRNAINGTKEADLKKRQDLYKIIPVKLKESAAYWEKCAAINSADQDGLYGLLAIYSDITLYDDTYEAKVTDLKKKMKALGLEVD
jgi:tetratricopeptide (TPR) repeat protein